MNQPTPTEPTKPRSRTQLWLLVALFFTPLLAAFVMYYGFGGWRPAGSTNKGDLISPARPLKADILLTPSDQQVRDVFKEKWTLVFIGDGRCDERCREVLVHMRQTRLALNQESARVQRVFLATANCCDARYFESEHPGLIVARADEPSDRELIDQFPRYNAVPVETANRIYIVDPLGNLMMSYAPDAPPKALLEDLKKLLKLSHIG